MPIYPLSKKAFCEPRKAFLVSEKAEYIERKETTIFKLIYDFAFIGFQTDCTKS